MTKAQKLVNDFISKNPEHADDANSFLELYEMEVESGESEDNEYNLLVGSLDDLLLDDEE